MSTTPQKSDAPEPGATMAELLHDDPSTPSHAPKAAVPETLAATGEFLAERSPALPPATALFGAGVPTGADAPGSAPTTPGLPNVTLPLDGSAPRGGLPPASTAARDRVGLAATEAIEATGSCTPTSDGAAPGSRLDDTITLGSRAGVTVDLATTGAFAPDGTHPESDLAAQGWPILAETDLMATEDFSAPAPAPSRRIPDVPPSSRCGRYVLKQFHAKGGMGEIWMAEDPEIGRPVALKRMLSEHPDQLCRFRAEAQVTGQLEHPGIVPVHDLGVNELGQTYYAMKFVQGQTLKRVVEEYHAQKSAGHGSEVEEVRLLQIFLSLCQTVAYAHSRNVLHRDLKPENVMLGEFGETILLDWGIAKIVGQEEDAPAEGGQTTLSVHLTADHGTETRVGAIMGTPGYMAPEVAMGQNEEVDFRSDVYLLGATLYEMLTARPPRTGKSAIEMVKKARNEPPPRVRTIDAGIPKALDAICFKAMAHLKKDRYQSARELADDLQRYLAGEPVTAYRETLWERTWRWARRHRVALGRAAVVLAFIGASALVYGAFRELQHESARLAREVALNTAREAARRDLKEFRRLADEASYYAATTDPVTEHAPYSDPRKGPESTKAALALAAKWGPTLEGLPLEDERPTTARAIRELMRLDDYLRTREPAPAKTVALPTPRSSDSGELLRSTRQIRLVSQRTPDVATSAKDRRHAANEPAPPETALDHYFRGEAYREQAARHKDVPPVRDAWKCDTELMEKAIAEYRKALALDPTHYWSHFQLGRCCMAVGRLRESVETLGACVALRPESAWGYSARGFALYELKRFEDAMHDLNEAVRLSPDSRLPRLNRGVVLWRQKNHSQAIADFTAVLEPPDEKRLIEGAYYLGLVHSQLGDTKNALQAFDTVVAENPRMRPVYYYRAVIHFANGNDRLGLDDLDVYIANGDELDREGWKTHHVRGHLLRAIYSEQPATQRREKWAQGLANLAVAELLQGITLGGRAWDVFDDIGAMLEHTGRLKDAIPAYSKGLQVEPNNVKLRNKRGWAWVNLGRHPEALADFLAATKADPENAEAYTGTGYVRAVLKQSSEAQRDAELALLHGADQFLVLHNIACIYATLAEDAGPRSEDYKDVALALLKRAVAKWKDADTPLNEIELIREEMAFKALRSRPDFQELIAPEANGRDVLRR